MSLADPAPLFSDGLARAAANPRAASLWVALAALVLFLPGFFTLQPMDRDEPRFAQASKQMLETGDYVDIRLQDVARYKKPVGIYWLQAATVRLGEALGVPDAHRRIWLYRLPSLAAAVLAVVLTYWAALPMTSPRGAFVAALLLAATILIGVEARLATTDAVVCASVVAAMGALARLYLPQGRTGATELARFDSAVRRMEPPAADWVSPAIFWTAIGVGVLVKGPITPLVPLAAALALVALALWRRTGEGVAWLRALRPVLGLAWVAVIVGPWLALIVFKSGGGFLRDSVGADMLAKVGTAQELHAAPPGAYAAAFLLTGWPLAPLAIVAAPFVWRARAQPPVRFLLAWIVPTWLIFELVSTKLPHYVLPLYPAVAILTALAIEHGGLAIDRLWGKAVLFLVPGVALALALAAPFVGLRLGTAPGLLYWAVLPFLAINGVLFARAVALGDAPALATRAALLSFFVAVSAYGGLLTGEFAAPFALSPRLAAARDAARATTACAALAAASAGDHEPSLVFLTDTSLLLTDGAGAAAFVNGGPCRIAFVATPEQAAFEAAPGAGVRRVANVDGVNINTGKHLDIAVYLHPSDAR